jgi:hypothetical protein
MKQLLIALSLTSFAIAHANQPLGEKVFFYDRFQRGTVHFADGRVAAAMLNYNFVREDMQFLEGAGEQERILSLARRPIFLRIQINEDVFVPLTKGYAVMVLDGPVALLQRRSIILSKGDLGSHAIVNPDSRGDLPLGFSRRDFDETSTVLRISPEVRYQIKYHFYLMKDGKIYPANKKNYLKLYSEIKPQMQQLLSEYKIDFSNIDHLRRLSEFGNNKLKTN